MENLRASQSMVDYFKKEQEAILKDENSTNKEELKQETLKEYFLGKMKEVLLFDNDAQAIRFMEKYFEAKWQQERMYSEEEVLDILFSMSVDNPNDITEWFKQFKKKIRYDTKRKIRRVSVKILKTSRKK